MKKQEPYTVNQSELGKILNYSDAQISKWIVKENLPVYKRTDREIYFIPADVIRWMIKRETEKNNNALYKAKTRLTNAQADRCELQNRRQKGELIDLAQLEKEWGVLLNNIKQKMLTIPKSISQMFDGFQNEHELEAELENNIRSVLDDLSDENNIKNTS